MVRAMTDLEVPVHALLGVEDGSLRVSVNRGAVTGVADEETTHRMGGEVEKGIRRGLTYP